MCNILKKGLGVLDDDDFDEDLGEEDDIAACRFDFKTTDSDFDIRVEKSGKCENLDEEECGEFLDREEEEEGEGHFESGRCGPKPKKSLRKYEYKDMSAFYNPPAQRPSELFYTGVELPSTAPKQTRTDYPTDLHLRKVCAPKPPRRYKTIDNYKTQAIAKFSPVSSKIRLAKKDSGLALLGLEESPSADFIQKMFEAQTAQALRPECQKMSRDPPPIVSISDEVVAGYLINTNVQMLLEYFLGHCLLKMPADPFHFIVDLTDKLIKGRKSDSAFKEIPRLLTKTHVEAMFRLYDRVGSGKISYLQYTNAMGSLGLVKFNQTPEGYETDEINQDTFVAEGLTGIDDLLKSFLFKRVEPKPKCI